MVEEVKLKISQYVIDSCYEKTASGGNILTPLQNKNGAPADINGDGFSELVSWWQADYVTKDNTMNFAIPCNQFPKKLNGYWRREILLSNSEENFGTNIVLLNERLEMGDMVQLKNGNWWKIKSITSQITDPVSVAENVTLWITLTNENGSEMTTIYQKIKEDVLAVRRSGISKR